MDITVVDAEGVSDQSFLSVRSGETKRLRPFRAGELFSFSKGHDANGFIQLDVFDKLGSQMMPGLPPTPAARSQAREILQQVHIPLDSGEAISACLKVALADPMPEKRERGPGRHKIALDAQRYLDKNEIWPSVQAMLHAMLKLRPDDPFEFMQDYIANLRRTRRLPRSPTSVPRSPVHQERRRPASPPSNQAFNLSDHYSVTADVLSNDWDMYHRLKDTKTPGGVTLAQCIKPGLECEGHPDVPFVGAVAGDEESYTVFRGLFDPIIQVWHNGYATFDTHPTDMTVEKVATMEIDPTGKYVVAARVRGGRNIRGLPFATACTQEERKEAERLVAKALVQIKDEDLEGEYLPMHGSNSFYLRPGGMSSEDESDLMRQSLLFPKPTSQAQKAKGLDRDWPEARGIFVSKSRNLVTWCNEEEHARVIAMDLGANLRGAFSRYVRAVDLLEEGLKQDGREFARTDHLGYISSCPSNLGTGLRVSLIMNLPLLAGQSRFKDVCNTLGLVARVSAPQNPCEVTNKDRLGLSEVEIMNKMIEGCGKLIALERRFEQGCPASGLSPKAMRPLPELPQNKTPGLGEDDCPGFPADKCPILLPDISAHHSILADVFRKNPSIYTNLRERRTHLDVGLARCIKSGLDNAGHEMLKTVGAIAGDEECYETFRELFDPIIHLRHGRSATASRHRSDLSVVSVSDIVIDPTGRYAVSARVRTSRSLHGVRFPTAIDRRERIEVERLLTQAIYGVRDADVVGEYFPLRGSKSYLARPRGMSDKEEDRLRNDHFLFQEPDSSVLLCSGMGRHWPEARGVFAASSKKLVAWINEEDHLRLISMQPGGGLREAFIRFSRTLAGIEERLREEGHSFAYNERLGYLTSCPSNLGTGLRASVMLRLPLLSNHPRFQEICRSSGLQARSTLGTGGQEDTGLFDVANAQRLGATEAELVNKVALGCAQLVKMEQALERGEEPMTHV
eukprot:TRINITY_DN15567_c0_g1_i1.p1 TRINITY_DN15567_c0_g1~~TRINITY_DN15567_c0_g1_i1.p1  ORF type:complete len:964 (-),score=177.46 TRINITY_DN15567_c0_g1_i1:137-3028(-)